ncbi:hypothetical protein WSM22_46050 [Cytophagales bacterium WSM2-2]|nr:hypothetical protein WSM22_46050 [Cytophagales bacterium WSM2-2]
MRKFFLFVGFLAFGWASYAQPYTSRQGRFLVNQIRGCAPFTVTITNTNVSGNGGCTPGSPCIMNFDGCVSPNCSCPGFPGCQNATLFTYNTPGTYKLSVLYQGVGSDDITITVDPNTQPAFDIYTCAASQVFINITDKTYDSYQIDFNNDGTIDKSIPSGNSQTATFTYATPPINFNISVKGQKLNAANNCTAKVQPFTALTTLPTPTITALTATDASTLQMAFTPQTNIQYKSEIAINNSTNFQNYQTLYGVNSMTASNLTVDKSYYCFRLNSFDPCANTNTYSAPICSHNFSMTVANGSDQLAWQTSSLGISNIQIKRNGTVLTTVPAATTNYNDLAITCKTDYCYQLVSRYAGATSTSLQKCGTSFLKLTPFGINNVSSNVGAAQVDLAWLQDPAFTAASYDVLRAQGGNTYLPLGTTTTKQFTDATYSEGSCYKVNYIDKCDNPSAQGSRACPMILNGSLDPTNEIQLHWTGYIGWNQGVKNYRVEKYFQPGQSPQIIYTGTDSTFLDTQQDPNNQVVYYKIIADANEAGVTSSTSNEIRIVKAVNLFSPNAFNPESKTQVNRTFQVRGHYISKLHMQVFDRWGSLVFYSDNNEPWDGRRDGIAMPDATYVWTAEGTDMTGNDFKKTGLVVLIRK